MSLWYNNKQIVSFKFENGIIEVVFREPSNSMYCDTTPVPDKVWKEIYGCENGEIVLLKTINGKHEPKYFVKEQFIFPEEG